MIYTISFPVGRDLFHCSDLEIGQWAGVYPENTETDTARFSNQLFVTIAETGENPTIQKVGHELRKKLQELTGKND